MKTAFPIAPSRRGPITPEGKARSSSNSIRHGLTAKTVVLSTENEAAFLELLENTIASLQPAGEVESNLVEEIAICEWKLRRGRAIENSLIDLELVDNVPNIQQKYERIGNSERTTLAEQSLHTKGSSLANIERYMDRIARQRGRALIRLQDLREHRLKLRLLELQVAEKEDAREAREANKSLETSRMQNEKPSEPEPAPPAPQISDPCPPKGETKENIECSNTSGKTSTPPISPESD
ncbi:MAG: hypothetical protein R2729_32810 [Bryobacteraceae bacterium]